MGSREAGAVVNPNSKKNVEPKPMKPFLALSLGALTLAAASAQAQTVYDNLGSPLGVYIGGFGPYGEIADDVQLAGSGFFSSARIAYAGTGFDGDETLTLTLYKMDGAPTPGSFGEPTPGTSIFTQTISLDGSGTADFSDPTPSEWIGGDIAIGLIFGGVDFDVNTSDAGPELYDPVTIGTSLDDYWLKGFGGDPDWAVYTFGGQPPANFGAQLNVVPEASTWMAMAGVGALAGFSVWRRARR